jgi:glycosyltransferase involved in cell wall biosynthesis
MINPIITFIVPTIGRETLSRTIQSILKQTSENWNCIIVYDGIEPQEFEDDRISTIKTEKIGGFTQLHGTAGLVRNEGIKLVTTQWIGFVDDDDTIHPQYVETLENNYQEYDLVIWRMKYKNGLVIPRLTDPNIYYGNVGISFSYKNKGNFLFEKNWDGEDFTFVDNLIKNKFNYIITPNVYYNINH